MWGLRMELPSCHPSGDWYFEVAPKFLENLFAPGLNDLYISFYVTMFEQVSLQLISKVQAPGHRCS